MTDDLVTAIPLYLGFGTAIYPQNDEATLRKVYGNSRADSIIVRIEQIIDDLNGVPIDWSSMDLVSAAKFSSKFVENKYPFLDKNALAALEWKYTFDWR